MSPGKTPENEVSVSERFLPGRLSMVSRGHVITCERPGCAGY